MKKFLQNLIARKKAELSEMEKRMKASSDVNEVRSLGETLIALRDEITDAEAQLKAYEEGKNEDGEGEGNGEGEGQLSNPPANGEGRSGKPAGRSSNFDPKGSYGQNTNTQSRSGEESEDPRGTMEYRKAFMDFVKTGKRSEVLISKRGNDDQNESTDLGVLLPITVVQEIMKETEKVYGQLYSGVKKTNIKGGVRYPIGAFDATFTRIGENGAPTNRQNGGSVDGYVEFTYKIGEIRLAQTLLANVLSVPVFEQELAKTIVEAYVKAMDNEILNGVGSNNQCEGILTEAAKIGQEGARLKSSQVITFTEDEMADWKTWQKNLFAKIPLSMRGLSPKFVMTPNTYEANIKTLHDDNNRPVYAETYNPVDGTERATFKGKEVTFVEEGQGIENFDDINPAAETGSKYFGIYWVPEKAYAINTNLEFAVKRYFDEEKLQWVDRAVVINDGKILDPKYIYLLKKVAPTV